MARKRRRTQNLRKVAYRRVRRVRSKHGRRQRMRRINKRGRKYLNRPKRMQTPIESNYGVAGRNNEYMNKVVKKPVIQYERCRNQNDNVEPIKVKWPSDDKSEQNKKNTSPNGAKKFSLKRSKNQRELQNYDFPRNKEMHERSEPDKSSYNINKFLDKKQKENNFKTRTGISKALPEVKTKNGQVNYENVLKTIVNNDEITYNFDGVFTKTSRCLFYTSFDGNHCLHLPLTLQMLLLAEGLVIELMHSNVDSSSFSYHLREILKKDGAMKDISRILPFFQNTPNVASVLEEFFTQIRRDFTNGDIIDSLFKVELDETSANFISVTPLYDGNSIVELLNDYQETFAITIKSMANYVVVYVERSFDSYQRNTLKLSYIETFGTCDIIGYGDVDKFYILKGFFIMDPETLTYSLICANDYKWKKISKFCIEDYVYSEQDTKNIVLLLFKRHDLVFGKTREALNCMINNLQNKMKDIFNDPEKMAKLIEMHKTDTPSGSKSSMKNVKEYIDINGIGKGFGLVNLGNTCFLNTALQLLFSCSEFISYCAKTDSDNNDSMRSDFKKLLEHNKDVRNPGAIVTRLNARFPIVFPLDRQGDSFEAIIHILDMLDEECEKSGSREIKELFSISYECNAKRESIFGVGFTPLNEQLSIEDLLNIYSELMEISFVEFAEYFVFYVSRNQSSVYNQISIGYIDNFETRNIKSYKGSNTLYQLIGLGIHLGGSVGGGHYYAKCFRSNGLTKLNDSRTSPSSLKDDDFKHATVLLYKRVSGLHSQTKKIVSKSFIPKPVPKNSYQPPLVGLDNRHLSCYISACLILTMHSEQWGKYLQTLSLTDLEKTPFIGYYLELLQFMNIGDHNEAQDKLLNHLYGLEDPQMVKDIFGDSQIVQKKLFELFEKDLAQINKAADFENLFIASYCAKKNRQSKHRLYSVFIFKQDSFEENLEKLQSSIHDFISLPKVLVVQKGTLSEHVNFPLTFKSTILAEECNVKLKMYTLKGLIYFIVNHYYAVCKNNGRFYKIDGNFIEEVPIEEINNQHGQSSLALYDEID